MKTVILNNGSKNYINKDFLYIKIYKNDYCPNFFSSLIIYVGNIFHISLRFIRH